MADTQSRNSNLFWRTIFLLVGGLMASAIALWLRFPTDLFTKLGGHYSAINHVDSNSCMSIAHAVKQQFKLMGVKHPELPLGWLRPFLLANHTPPSPCYRSPTFSFRYRGGGGGWGDNIKGQVAALQVAYALGMPFRVDIGNHQLGQLVPYQHGVVENIPADATYLDMVDAGLRPDLIARFERELDSCAWLNHDLAMSVNVYLPASLITKTFRSTLEGWDLMGESAFKSFYSKLVDGSRLAQRWGDCVQPDCLRVGVHFRAGDSFMLHAARLNESDRVDSHFNDLLARVGALPARVAKWAAGIGKRYRIYVAADSAVGRELVVQPFGVGLVINSNTSVIPVHTDKMYGSTPEHNRAVAETMHEHYTLFKADLLVMVTYSGFSLTACNMAKLERPATECWRGEKAEWQVT